MTRAADEPPAPVFLIRVLNVPSTKEVAQRQSGPLITVLEQPQPIELPRRRNRPDSSVWFARHKSAAGQR